MRTPAGSCTALVLLGIVLTAPSQAAGTQPIWGVRSGVSVARLHGDYGDVLGNEARSGFAASAFMRLGMGDLFSLQPEFGWIPKGGDGGYTVTFSGTGSTQIIDATMEHRIDYLQALLARMEVPLGSSVGAYLVGGPGFAVRVASDVELSSTTFSPAPARIQRAQIFESAGTFPPEFRTTDWSVVGGAGLKVGAGFASVIFDVRYDLGLRNVFSESAPEARNGGWVISAGFEAR